MLLKTLSKLKGGGKTVEATLWDSCVESFINCQQLKKSQTNKTHIDSSKYLGQQRKNLELFYLLQTEQKIAKEPKIQWHNLVLPEKKCNFSYLDTFCKGESSDSTCKMAREKKPNQTKKTPHIAARKIIPNHTLADI